MKNFSRIQTMMFVLTISLPLAANFAGRDGADPSAENRELATLNDGVFAWFEDHFGFRARLVGWNARLRFEWLRTSPSPAVVRGVDDWLFYAQDGALEDYVGASPLTPDGVNAWKETVLRSRDVLRARGIGYVFTIAPDKHVIYPEKFPRTIRRLGSTSRADQIFGAVAHAGVAVDLRPALMAARQQERIYHVTDTHWNARGVLPAYQAIVTAARTQVPGIAPAWDRSDFEEKTRVVEGMDLAGMMGLKRVLSEEDLALVPKRPRRAKVVDPAGAGPTDELGRIVTEIPGSTLPRAVIVRDSFVSPMVPFLSEHFSRAVYLWQNDFVPGQVLDERPDVVIYEIVGRHLHTFVPSPELITK